MYRHHFPLYLMTAERKVKRREKRGRMTRRYSVNGDGKNTKKRRKRGNGKKVTMLIAFEKSETREKKGKEGRMT